MRIPAYYFVTALSVATAGSVRSQEKSVIDSVSKDIQVKVITNLFDSGQNGDDRLNFPGLVSGLVEFSGNNGATGTFQSTIYGLKRLFSNRPLIDGEYANEVFARNFQINLGLTPNQKNIVSTPKDGRVGFTYAFINNKSVTQEQFHESLKNSQFILFQEIMQFVTSYLAELANSNDINKLKELKLIQCQINNKEYTCFPPDLLAAVKERYHITLDEKFFAIPNKITDSLTKALEKQPLLTLEVSAIYSFTNGALDSNSLKIHYSTYILRQLDVDPSWSSDISITSQPDTSKKTINQDRHIMNLSTGLVFGTWSIGPVNIDLKFSLEGSRILQGTYANEHLSSLKVSLSPIFKFGKVTLPITLGYDFRTQQITGGWKLQF